MAGLEFTKDQIQAYRYYFSMFDLDGNGLISAKELKEVSRRLGYRLTSQQVNEIMNARDMDENGALSFDEFLLAMPANMIHIPKEEHEKAEVRRKFLEFDKDGNGSVTAEEAHEILKSELGFTPKQSQELIKRYDKNGDGQLSYEEFVKFYTKVKSKAKQIQELFREFDTDGSGTVSVEEAKEMLSRLDIPENQIETLVEMYDTNNDGQLQYDEFVRFLLHK